MLEHLAAEIPTPIKQQIHRCPPQCNIMKRKLYDNVDIAGQLKTDRQTHIYLFCLLLYY